jgi:DNA-binding GntR family transcriptional regulator
MDKKGKRYESLTKPSMLLTRSSTIWRAALSLAAPSQSALAEMYNISRTTVRHILCHLCERGVLSQVNHDYQILRQPEVQDGFDGSSASLAEQNRLFEQAFFTMINQRQLRAGERFSELARAAGVSPVVVREFY